MNEYDTALDAEFQKVVAAISGLSGALVRPRWQPGNPQHPEPATTWCSIGVTTITPDAGPYIGHPALPADTGAMQRHEDIELEVTCYGPAGQQLAARIRDGLHFPEYLEALQLFGVVFVGVGGITSVPELYNQQWIKRYDFTAEFRRQVRRTYTTLSIESSEVVIKTDSIGNETIAVIP